MTPYRKFTLKTAALLTTTKHIRQAFEAALEDSKDLKKLYEEKGNQVPPGYYRRLVAEFNKIPEMMITLHQQATLETEKLHNELGQAIEAFKKDPAETARNWQPNYGPIKKVEEDLDRQKNKLVALRRALDMN